MQWTYPFKLEAVGDCSSDASSLLEHLMSWVDAVTVADEIPRELHPALIVVVDPSGDVVWDFLGFKSDCKLKKQFIHFWAYYTIVVISYLTLILQFRNKLL